MNKARSLLAATLLCLVVSEGISTAATRSAPFDQATQCGINKGNMANGTYCLSDPSPTLALGAPFLPARAGVLSVGGQQSAMGYPIPYLTSSSVSNFTVSSGAFSVKAFIEPVVVALADFSLCLSVQQSSNGAPFSSVGEVDCIQGQDLYFRPLAVNGTATSGAILKSTVTLTLPPDNGLPSSPAGVATIRVSSMDH